MCEESRLCCEYNEDLYTEGEVAEIIDNVYEHIATIRTANDSDCPGKFWIFGKPVWITKAHFAAPDEKTSGCVVVEFSDDTKTISRCHGGDTYSPETGFAICLLKKFIGNQNTRELLMSWMPEENQHTVTLKQVRKKSK